jgi:hypothetical protein
MFIPRQPCPPAIASVVTIGLLSSLSAPAMAFRITPYLQQPSTDGMYFTWFTEQNTPGTLTVTGDGLSNPLVFSSAPTSEAALTYTSAERSQTIAGLAPGSWLISDNNYKHTIDVRGLQPNTTYQYRVAQDANVFSSSFRTAPAANNWELIRFIAMSDSETEPLGRTTRREWQPGALATGSAARPELAGSQWATQFGTSGTGAAQTLRYALTETEGYRRNLEIVNGRNPDFLLMPGDLVQGGGYQPGWDEFFRHNAGEFDAGLSRYPILPALGNWENFGALNGGYGIDRDGRFGPKFGRDKYHVYVDAPDNGTPAHRDNYYRVDYGPLTIITLDSSNGEPEDRPQNYGGAGQPPKISGREYTGPGTDTQNNFTRQQYEAAGGTDLVDFNPGSTQWNWAVAQLQDARAKGQIVFVQFHHTPYSDGEHGLPMNHVDTSGQGGTPMRQYQRLFEQFNVAAVLVGHSEMFERSFVDEDGDGLGVTYFEVGVSGDGLRGERRTGAGFNSPLLNYNPYSQWTADQSEPELWADVNGVLQLLDGGKHYGHLEVTVERLLSGNDFAKITLTPVYSFPILDANYNLVRTDRRIYENGEIALIVDRSGRVAAVPEPGSMLGLLLTGLGSVAYKLRRQRSQG